MFQGGWIQEKELEYSRGRKESLGGDLPLSLRDQTLSKNQKRGVLVDAGWAVCLGSFYLKKGDREKGGGKRVALHNLTNLGREEEDLHTHREIPGGERQDVARRGGHAIISSEVPRRTNYAGGGRKKMVVKGKNPRM